MRILFILMGLILFFKPAKTQDKSYAIDQAKFHFVERESRKIVNVEGREALYLNGKAFLKEVTLADGIVEVDVLAEKKRSFAGLMFRVKDQVNYEALYLRMHKSGSADAVQYNPEFNGEANWQLYREHQKYAKFDAKKWTHLKIEIQGQQLKVYIDNAKKPVLEVDHLKLDNAQGFIGFYSFLGSYFTNFRYTTFKDKSGKVRSVKNAAGIVKEWELSPSMLYKNVNTGLYPGKTALDRIEWVTGKTEPSGLLPINKYRKKRKAGSFEKNEDEVVWARHTFESDEEGQRKFYFDYSDNIDLYFNGRLLFSGKNAFRFKGPMYRGDIHIEGNAVYFNVKKGSNEILCAVTDKANGWGLLGKFEE
ncbi:DUF1080 domain-containing protein [Fulvivirga sp. M361]|uniref:family 16 glycoside hydrolase n=1 Tax=Fulvivirga sp. M361 TaxID=2594266 RepID=UPI00117B4903|nr:family 16 glycoside hydrolase [Fulvivirga sp. M361]TRX59109.1 DUF1080 domain-containing protein [Fulvivirga sp. M361]